MITRLQKTSSRYYLIHCVLQNGGELHSHEMGNWIYRSKCFRNSYIAPIATGMGVIQANTPGNSSNHPLYVLSIPSSCWFMPDVKLTQHRLCPQRSVSGVSLSVCPVYHIDPGCLSRWFWTSSWQGSSWRDYDPLVLDKASSTGGHQGYTVALVLLEHGTVCPADKFLQFLALPVYGFPSGSLSPYD